MKNQISLILPSIPLLIGSIGAYLYFKPGITLDTTIGYVLFAFITIPAYLSWVKFVRHLLNKKL